MATANGARIGLYRGRGGTPGHRRNRPRYTRGNRRPYWGSNWWWFNNPSTDIGWRPRWPIGGGSGGGTSGGTEPPKPEVIVPEKVDAVLKAQMIDLHKESNRKAHHTDEYEDSSLIVRRGQLFEFTAILNSDFDKATDKVIVQLTKGETPQQNKGTLVRLRMSDKLTGNDWCARLSKINGNEITIQVQPAADAVVGKYKLFVETFDKEGNYFRYKNKEELVILFNPWCKADQCFVPDEAERNEYILNEDGRIWVGAAYRNNGRIWHFGQFEEQCLNAALYLLERSDLKDTSHGNPILVARKLTAMANDNDGDGGVLAGNWSGDYSGGTSPSKWTGSPAIFDEFMRTKRTVKFGQCWVFSGILTTLCRTLGIPSRSVTNFDSAHDTDLSMTIDNHWASAGRPLKHLDDSVWNFHVWNEAYMSRPDLPDGMGGWQAIDSTPQEQSEGIFRCGPAPVNAIKEGLVYLGQDTKFIFGEVNGDRVKWVQEWNGELRAIGGDQHAIGHQISTKAVGSNTRNDVTDHYKYPEGSQEEREAVKRASKHSSRKAELSDLYKLEERQDLVFTPSETSKKNGDAIIKTIIKNKSDQARTVDIVYDATATYYTGIAGETLKEHNVTVTIPPKQERFAEWTILGKDYLNEVDEDANIGVYMCAHVQETDQFFTHIFKFTIEKPDLQIAVPMTDAVAGEEIEVTISMPRSELEIDMTNGELRVEGAGQKQVVINIPEAIRPGDVLTRTVKMTPRFHGNRTIYATFNSRQLTNITGDAKITVLKA